MKVAFLQSRFSLFFLLVLLNVHSALLLGHEYVLEVEAAQGGFKITTNIPKAEEQKQNVDKTEIPVTTFNAQSQQLLLSNANNLIDVFIDQKGQVCIKQMNMKDPLRIKNSTTDGNIIFEGAKQQYAHGLILEGRSCFNKTDLSLYFLKASLSGFFISDMAFIINRIDGKVPSDKQCAISCFNFKNNNLMAIHQSLKCTVVDSFNNSSNIIGDGSLLVTCNKFLTETNASIALNGQLDVQPSQPLDNNARRCSWPCILDDFGKLDAQATLKNRGSGWASGFLGSNEQATCLQLKDRTRDRFNAEHDCSEILLLGVINIGGLNISAQNIVLQGSVHIENDCTIKPLYVFRNSGSLYIKGAFNFAAADYFYNDINGVLSVGKTATIHSNRVAANISGAIAAHDIKVNTDKFINARGASNGYREGARFKPNSTYRQVETMPFGYIIAREGSVDINVNEFRQEASVLFANDTITMKVSSVFSNVARELKHEHTDSTGKDSFDFTYEPSTIAAGKDVVVEVKGVKIDFNAVDGVKVSPDFHNTGTIQGLQLVELDMLKDQALLVNGFTHKLRPANFAAVADVMDLYDEMIPKEYEHIPDVPYYFTHALFKEKEAYRSMQEVAIEADNVKPNIEFLMSPMLEAMNLEFGLHKIAGRNRITKFQSNYDQCNDLVTQGLIYALIHGTLTPVFGTPLPSTQIDDSVNLNPRPDKNKDHLLIKIPTRSRPEKFFATLDNLYSKLSGNIPCTFLITCDTDDETMNNPTVIDKLKQYKNLYFYFGEGSTKVAAYNRDIEKHLDFDVLLVLSDDLEPLVRGFDERILKLMKFFYKDFNGVLRFETLNKPHNINQYPAIGKAYYDRFGYIYYPEYVSLYCDSEFVDVAQAFHNEKVIKQDLFKHNHPLIVGGALDELYKDNESTLVAMHDRNVYESRKQLGQRDFGAKVDHGPEKMLKIRRQRRAEELERQGIKLTQEEIADYQKLIKKFNGRMSPQEFARRLKALTAKTHFIQLEDWQINTAPVSFIYYKVENREGKEYLHPYFHPDKESVEKMRQASGTITGGEIKGNGGNWQNLGFIKADKQLLLRVNSLLCEKANDQRITDIYAVSGGIEAGSVDARAKKGITVVGGTVIATEGPVVMESEEESVQILAKSGSNPDSSTPTPAFTPSTVASSEDIKLKAKKRVKVKGSTTVAGGKQELEGEEAIDVETVAEAVNLLTEKKGNEEHRKQDVVMARAQMTAGKGIFVTTKGKATYKGASLNAPIINSSAKQGNDLKPVIVETRETSKKVEGSLFSAQGTEKTHVQQNVIQTELNADQVILTSDLDNTLEAVVIHAGELVHIVSGKDTVFKGAHVNSATAESGWSFGISFLGSSALQSAVGGDLKNGALNLAETDPLFAAISNLKKAKDSADVIAGTEYLGIEAVRSLVQLSKSAKLPATTGIAQRLGIVNGEGKFSPRLTFSLGWFSNEQSTTQTIPTQINAMKFVVESVNDTVFADGTVIIATTSSVKSKHLKFGPAMQVQRSTNSNGGFDFTIDESGLGAGIHGSVGGGKSVHYQNAVFDVENQTWQADDMSGQGVTLRGRIGHFDIKRMNLESVQSTDKSTNVGGSLNASQSGAFSGSFNYHGVDNAWINERSCLEFEELHGHIEHLKQLASDIKAGTKSTLKVDKAEGVDLQDHLDEQGINVAASYGKGNAVPITADLDYLRKHDGGKQKSHISESINVAQAENVVRNEKDAYVADKKVDRHIHFVAAWIDTQQVKQAFNDLQDLFKKKDISIQEFSEKFDALKKEGGVKEYTDADRDQEQESGVEEQPVKASEKTEITESQQKTDDKDQSQGQKAKTASTEPDASKTRKAPIQPGHYKHHTSNGQVVEYDFCECAGASADNSQLEAFVLEDTIFDPVTKTKQLFLRNNRFQVKITGDPMAIAQAMLDRKVQIRGMIENFNPQVITLEEAREEAKHSLKSAASLLLDFVPVIGNVKMASEAIRGVDLVTGEPLAGWQRALCALGAAAPFIAKGIKLAYGAAKGVNVATDVASDIGKTAKVVETTAEASKVEKVVSEGAKAAETVSEGAKAEKAFVSTTKEAAEEVGKLFNGVVEKTKGSGWKVTILDKNGETIVIRLMDAGSGGRTVPYFRVSIGGKGPLNLAGKISSDRGLTHIDLTDKYLDMIKNMINNH